MCSPEVGLWNQEGKGSAGLWDKDKLGFGCKVGAETLGGSGSGKLGLEGGEVCPLGTRLGRCCQSGRWVGWAGHWLLSSLQGGSASSVALGLGPRPASIQCSGLFPSPCSLLSYDPDLALLPSFWLFVWRGGPSPRRTLPAIPVQQVPASGFCTFRQEPKRVWFLPCAAFPGGTGIPLVWKGLQSPSSSSIPLSGHSFICSTPLCARS